MYEYVARSIRVIDGDTIEAIVDLGFSISKKERFRLLGIDAPETRTRNQNEKKKGLLAKAYLHNAVMDADEVKIRTAKKGKYGRYLAIVYLDKKNINEKLVKEGLAKLKKY